MITRGYEALIILKAAGTEQEVARHAAQLDEQVKKVGGRVESSHNMGRRRFAFRIARQTEGYYYLVRFQAPTEQIGELERLFRLNETIVRFMILNADETALAVPGTVRPAPLQESGTAPTGPLQSSTAPTR